MAEQQQPPEGVKIAMGWHDEGAPRIDLSANGLPAADAQPAGPDPERDARIEVYRDRERRRAARALDRYIDTIFPGHGSNPGEATMVANERFVEAVGDYVMSRLGAQPCWQHGDNCPGLHVHTESPLQQKSDYDATPDPGVDGA